MRAVISLLIVDDEEVTRRGLTKLIDWGACGVQLVAAASNGLEALRELELHHPAIVILDVRMPELDGIGVLSIIRARYPYTRTILISGFEDFADAQKAVNLAAFAFLSKPIDRDLLARKVCEAAEAIRAEQSAVRGSEELRREFDRFAPALRTSFLCRLMSPAPCTEEEAAAQARFLGLTPPPDFPAFLVASVVVFEMARREVPASPVDGSRVASDEFSRFALAQRAEACLGASGRGFAFPFGDCVCVVVFHASAERSGVRRGCRELIDWAASAMGCAVAAGIGLSATRLTDLHASYDCALQALGYRFMLGQMEAIDFEDLREHALAAADEGPSLAELRACATAIAQSMRADDEACAAEALSKLVGELTRRLPRQVPLRPTLAWLLSFVLADVHIALGVRREEDVFAALASSATAVEIEERAQRFLKDLVRRTRDSGKKRDDALARKAKEYMHEHVLDDVSLTVVAEALRIHPNYLSTVFHASVGKTFIEYEIGVKMEAAKKLLAEGDHRVYEVADLLKYRDVNHFTRTFKVHVGVSPSEYRSTLPG
jgi:two-component system, response regulator YesN